MYIVKDAIYAYYMVYMTWSKTGYTIS